MSGAIGVQAKCGLGSASPVTEAYEFLRDGVMLEEVLADTSGIRGTRSRPKERERIASRMVKGPLVINPTPLDLTNLLPRILGAAGVANVYNLAETLPSFFMTSDRVTKVHTFNGMVASKATFKATVGAPLELTLDLVGIDESIGAAGTFPAISPDLTNPPYILADLAFNLGGNAYTVEQIEIAIDNVLEIRFGNSITPTAINPTDRHITLSTRVPWSDSFALYGAGDPAGLSATATFTNGAKNLIFTMPALVYPKKSPIVDARGEIWQSVDGVAMKSGGTNELAVTQN